MTLPQAALRAPDETATPTVSIPEIDRLHLEPRCHVCRNDVARKTVNDLLTSGSSCAWSCVRSGRTTPRSTSVIG
jgi:hypothetical protein